jgi:tyrosyl-tRNA synthetase
MSKSLGNYIGITDPPSEIYGKTMSIPDQLLAKYYALLTAIPKEEYEPQIKLSPRDAKARLAGIFVETFYNKKEAVSAEAEFNAIFREGKTPDEVQVKAFKEKQKNIVDILFEGGLAPSKSEARRLIAQGGVRINEEVVKDDKAVIDLGTEKVVNVGKRKFLRVRS